MRASDNRTLLYLAILALIVLLATALSMSKRSNDSSEESEFMTVIAPAQEGR
jgi:ABC-type phosphate/phosphonate transport system substrate-binding protein